MTTPTKEQLQSCSAAQAALWVYNTDPDLSNPFDKTDERYHEFNNELFNLECER